MSPIGSFTTSASLWIYPGNAGWHFVTLPEEVSQDVRDLTAGLRRGFGSVRVEVTVGASTWRTSVFPDSRSGNFMLPIKKQIRTTERLTVGDAVPLKITLVDL